MSIQRAVMNCRRCYAMAGLIIEDIDGTIDCDERKNRQKYNRLIKNDSLCAARNEAMRALENPVGITLGENENGLVACMNCDYSSPKIAEMFVPKPEGERK